MNRIRFFIGIWIIRRADYVRVVSDRIANTLNLLGVKSSETDLYKQKNDPKIKLFYLLLDTNGNIKYKY